MGASCSGCLVSPQFASDASGNGDLDASEFVDGCMRLKGPARSIDVSLLLQEQRRIRKKIVSALIESLWHICGSKDSMDNGLICKQYLICVHMYWLNNLPNVVFFSYFPMTHDVKSDRNATMSPCPTPCQASSRYSLTSGGTQRGCAQRDPLQTPRNMISKNWPCEGA